MTLPNVADPAADYAMPAGGFADYQITATDPTTDWASGNPPGQNATGGPGASQLINDVAGMTRTARRAWARFTAGSSPLLAATNPDDAVWGNASGVLPVVAHSSTGVFTMTWPSTIVDQFGTTRSINLRWARVSVEGSTCAFAQCSVTSPNVVTVYLFNTSFAANDLSSSYTILVEAG
jgi:hypothetical protein